MLAKLPLMPRGLLIWTPILMLPILIGYLFTAVPAAGPSSGGRWTFLLIAMVLAWYILGGMIAFRSALDGLAARRAMRLEKGRLNSPHLCVLACDRDGTVLAQSPGALRKFGDLTGRPIEHVLRAEIADASGTLKRLWRRAETGDAATARLSDGALSFELRAAGALGLLELTALDSPTYPGAAPRMEHLPVALLRIGHDGTVLDANDAACRFLGPISSGQHIAELLDGLGRPLIDWIQETLSGQGDSMPQVLHATGERQERFVQVELCRDDRYDGQVFAVLSDARALKTLEAQFVQSQKMQAVGQLAGGIAHDFNNLLTAISGHCDLLMLRHDKGDPDFADLDQISQNTNRAANLVGQLLAFSRKQKLKPETLNLRDTISDLTHLLNRLVGERVELRFRHDPALRAVRADKGKIEQVLMNLVVNARDAMPSGGKISIETANHVLVAEEAHSRFAIPPGDYVKVAVSDNGSGIPEDKIEKIFEPFFTTKRLGEGTGLGLSTAYGIVKQTGGYIFCDSRPGEGTRFTIYLPALEQGTSVENANAPDSAEPQSSTTLLDERPRRVLLVEDEAPVRAFASRALSLKGYEVITAESGEDALEQLSDHRLDVDIFVTDVVMPGLDGLAWVRIALKDRPHAKVIFMSGYTEDVFEDGRAPLNGAGFLQKPFSLTQLVEMVAQHLAKDRSAENV